jgi:hypothetical protein
LVFPAPFREHFAQGRNFARAGGAGDKEFYMKRCTIALVLILSLLSLAAVGFNGCGKKNTITSITITPVDPFIVKLTARQLSVTAHFSDGMYLTLWTQVTWQSSDPTVATVNSTGLVSAVKEGTAVITAIDKAHPSITCSVTVNVMETPLVSIDVVSIDVASGAALSNLIISMGTTTQVQFTATLTLADGTVLPNLGSSVTWSSSRTGVATISNSAGSGGLATAVAAGTTWIVATDPVTNISGLTTLTVTP